MTVVFLNGNHHIVEALEFEDLSGQRDCGHHQVPSTVPLAVQLRVLGQLKEHADGT